MLKYKFMQIMYSENAEYNERNPIFPGIWTHVSVLEIAVN